MVHPSSIQDYKGHSPDCIVVYKQLSWAWVYNSLNRFYRPNKAWNDHCLVPKAIPPTAQNHEVVSDDEIPNMGKHLPSHQPNDLPSGKRRKHYGNHRLEWVNPLFLWPFSVANCLFTRLTNSIPIVPTINVPKLPNAFWLTLATWDAPNFVAKVTPSHAVVSSVPPAGCGGVQPGTWLYGNAENSPMMPM